MGHGCSSGVYFLQNYILIFSVTSANIPTSYIVGLTYYQLGQKYINIIIPAIISSNAVLIITWYESYHSSFRPHSNVTISVARPGTKNMNIMI